MQYRRGQGLTSRAVASSLNVGLIAGEHGTPLGICRHEDTHPVIWTKHPLGMRHCTFWDQGVSESPGYSTPTLQAKMQLKELLNYSNRPTCCLRQL